MLGEPETMHAHRRRLLRIDVRRLADIGSGDAADRCSPLRRPIGDEGHELGHAIDARAEEAVVDAVFDHQHVRKRVQQRHIAAGAQRQMHVGDFGKRRAARIDDDQLRAAAHLLTDARAHHRVVRERIGTDHQEAARLLDVVEAVGRGAGTEHALQRRGARHVADAGAAIDVVGAEHEARELLRQERFFIGTACGAEHADGIRSVLGENAAQLRHNF